MKNHNEHYQQNGLMEPIDLQEMIGTRLDQTDLTYPQKHSIIAAIKYVRRIGLKQGEDAGKEADKIAQYFYRAIKGKWVSEIKSEEPCAKSNRRKR